MFDATAASLASRRQIGSRSHEHDRIAPFAELADELPVRIDPVLRPDERHGNRASQVCADRDAEPVPQFIQGPQVAVPGGGRDQDGRPPTAASRSRNRTFFASSS